MMCIFVHVNKKKKDGRNAKKTSSFFNYFSRKLTFFQDEVLGNVHMCLFLKIMQIIQKIKQTNKESGRNVDV
jgi:hypothetical protein